ncbi:DUF6708 domain-containing protein [Marinobacter persicus]|uniref:DUF6708 domain-containing protein n=1 Tax=Marinobacter persicus TaxID=930118 RepID=A0A2S6G2P1_9GAMM|nr:DUF6708 domain-containing protein [Marinobacter persicus]PPK49917.1 hypothetical protein BY455_1422 [Marinobacter persicus]PPK51602.1 hypothetical protein B0H24_104313 [Marinobacter persicus]PPK56252.1 hypothetical protein BY454_1432 [Marinobacter persicus]
MDYAGLDYSNIRFPVDRPLTEAERAVKYRQKDTGNASPMDFLSVIKFNSHYMDLVDRWYPIKGFNTWFGACVAAGGVFFAVLIIAAFFWAPATNERSALWFMIIVLLPISLVLVWGGWWLIRTECGRYTHYPMRLNRKTRQVHFFRQNGTVLTVPWDSLFLTLGESKSPLSGTTYDLRAHVLEEDGKTVRESFSLGYPSPLGNAESIDKFWAFLQPYMEAEDGVERTWRHLKENTGYLVPVDGRKEGWRWSIARSFILGAHWPYLQLVFSPFLGLNAVGRMLAMSTSKIPQWPEEVEQANPMDADDPYVLTWRDNGPLGWWELYWPLICTVVGVGTFVGVIAWVVSGLWR